MNIFILIADIILVWLLVMNLGRVLLSFIKTSRPWAGRVSKYLNGVRGVVRAVYRFSFLVTEPILRIVRLLPVKLFVASERTDIRTRTRELVNRSGRKPRRGLLLDVSPLIVTTAMLYIVVPALLVAASS